MRRGHADLIVLDFMMPGMDGHEFVAKVRALPGAKAVPIVMITAATERQVRHRALDLGVTDFLTKPLDSYEMRARLANLIALRRGYLQLQDRSRWLAEEVRKATEKTLHLPTHDPLTGLPNRSCLPTASTALVRAGRSRAEPVACCSTSTGSRTSTTRLGHAAGDLLLPGAAESCGSVREADTVARLGGDEFAIVQVGADAAGGFDEARRPRARGAAGVVAATRTATRSAVGVSIGVALFPLDGSIPALCCRRRLALYRAKEEGRTLVPGVRAGHGREAAERRALETRPARGIAPQSFAPLPAHGRRRPPTPSSASRRWSAGAIRSAGWCGRPSSFRSRRSPASSSALGEWVLHSRLCSEAADWPSHLQPRRDTFPRPQSAARPAALVAAGLAAPGSSPGARARDHRGRPASWTPRRRSPSLRELKALGGPDRDGRLRHGLLELELPAALPVRHVKIDRSFVADLAPGRRQMPSSARWSGSAHGLRMRTAEGVETVQRLAVLRVEGCDEVQGYLIGRPLPVGELRSYLARVAHEGAPRSAHDRGASFRGEGR